MKITIELSARDLDETAEYVRHVAGMIENGYISGIDGEAFWDSEGLAE